MLDPVGNGGTEHMEFNSGWGAAAVGGDAVDDVEKALLQAYELIESTVAEHRRTASDEILATGSFDRAAGEDLVRELIAGTRHGLSMTMPADSTVAAAACAV